MTISRPKAKIKAHILSANMCHEIANFRYYEGKTYASLDEIPSGKRFKRYAKRARLRYQPTFYENKIVGVQIIYTGKY